MQHQINKGISKAGGGGDSDSNSSSNDDNNGGSGGDINGNDNDDDGNWQLFFLPLLTTVGPSEGTIAHVIHSYNTVMTQSSLPSLFEIVRTIIAFEDIDHPNGGIIAIV